MRNALLALVFALTAACDCLPNPQSEWVTSEGGVQRSTVDDETITHSHVGHVAHVGHRGRHR